MEKLEVVTELRIRRETAEGPLRKRKQLVAKLAPLCAAPTMMNEYRLLSWEIREHVPYEVHACALRAYFDVDSIAKLGLGHTFESAHHWTYATKEERKAEVHRRLLLARGVKASLLGPALLPVGPLTALGQMLGGRRSLGLADVAHAERVATHLASEYLADPNRETVRAAIAHARTLTDRLKRADMSSDVRDRLAAVAADAASLAGYTAFHAGDLVRADGWFRRAIELARQAEDPRLEALATAATAWTVVKESTPCHWLADPKASLDALQAAAAFDRSLPPAGRAYVQAVLSRQFAGMGEDQPSGHALERARRAAAFVGQEERGWGWWSRHGELSGWDGSRMTVFTGLRLAYLGRHGQAVPLLEEALAGTTAPVRHAHLHIELVAAFIELDDPERARAEALAALDEADAHRMDGTKDELREMRAGFPSEWPDWATAELDERLAAG